jgi:hypothetical protein
MKLLLLTFLFQLDTLPPTDTLVQSLIQFHQQQAKADIQAFNSKEQYSWMKYVPSIGIGYNLQGQPRPTINYSLATVYRYFNDKNQSKAQQKAIIQQNELQLNLEIMQLHTLIKKLQLQKEDYQQAKKLLKHQTQLIDIERQLFAIEEDKYKRNDLLPSQFLQAQKRYLNILANHENQKFQLQRDKKLIQELEFDILQLAKYYPTVELVLMD